MNYPRLLYWAALAWTLIMLIGCLTPGPDIPPVLTLNDKFMHVAIFAPFAVLWMLAGRSAKWTIVAGFTYGILIEVFQGILPIHRSADVLDAIADCIGTLLGVGIALGMRNYVKF